MSNEFTMSTKAVVVALVKVALTGKLREIRNKCVYFNQYYDTDPQHIEIKRLLCNLEKGQPVKTEFEDLVDLLAHACQTARIPADIWESILCEENLDLHADWGPKATSGEVLGGF